VVFVNETDARLLRESFQLAHLARSAGNHPFGAVLADSNGMVLLREQNTVITSADCTAHAELNLVRKAVKKFTAEALARCTVYASTEPCPMCAGAIFWANIGRVVYGLSEEGLYALTGDTPHKLLLSCREVFQRGGRKLDVIGPLLETDAVRPHEGFWRLATGAF
jgi:tRNA(adenine34) deaminase